MSTGRARSFQLVATGREDRGGKPLALVLPRANRTPRLLGLDRTPQPTGALEVSASRGEAGKERDRIDGAISVDKLLIQTEGLTCALLGNCRSAQLVRDLGDIGQGARLHPREAHALEEHG